MSCADAWIIDPQGRPHPGLYQIRLAKGGHPIPVSLRAIEPERGDDGERLADVRYELIIDREVRDWTKQAPISGEPISEADYRYLVACREYDETYGTAWADAHTPVNLRELPPIF